MVVPLFHELGTIATSVSKLVVGDTRVATSHGSNSNSARSRQFFELFCGSKLDNFFSSHFVFWRVFEVGICLEIKILLRKSTSGNTKMVSELELDVK